MPFLRAIRAMLAMILAASLGTALVAVLVGLADRRWTSTIDLGAPVGPSTRVRLALLDGAACRAALNRAGVAYRTLPDRADAPACALADTVAWVPGGARDAAYSPAAPPLACPLAAALALWEWNVVQPAALALLGSPVVAIEHVGSYACRRRYGHTEGAWSAHAAARAIDVTGFRLADGRRIGVAADWRGRGGGAFLHRVRDGGCRLFSTTLSPDYNRAHQGHLHLESAAGAEGLGGACG